MTAIAVHAVRIRRATGKRWPWNTFVRLPVHGRRLASSCSDDGITLSDRDAVLRAIGALHKARVPSLGINDLLGTVAMP